MLRLVLRHPVPGRLLHRVVLLPLPLVLKLADAMVGKGDPPIIRAEVLALAGIVEAAAGAGGRR